MRSKILALILAFTVILAAACAPKPSSPDATQSPTQLPVTVPSAENTPQPTMVEIPTVVAVATSRGPDLEATDPATVSLAAGQLQLVEFFRFS